MRSIRRQLIIGLVVAFALLIGGGGLLVYWSVRSSVYAQFDAALKVKALIVVTDTQISAGRVRVYFSDRFLREFDRSVATEFYQVFDQQGQTIALSDSLGTARLPGKLRGPIDAPVYWNLTLPTGDLGRAIGVEFSPRVRAGEETQKVTVVVAVSRRGVIATMDNLRNILVASGGALLLLTALVVPWVLRRGLRPLDALGERIARVDADTLGQRFTVEKMPRELLPVAHKLNDLLARLEASFERERRFGADLAHELRTPLAELRAQAELALRWPEERGPDMDRAVLEITRQMEALVTRLLALSRAEDGRQVVQKASVAVADVIEAQLRSHDARIATARLQIENAVPADAVVRTDAVLFESVVANLVGNAVAYAPEGTRVRVACELRADGTFVFTVSNRAPELAPEDLPRMFDRFWRKDRARTGGGGHAGLGLALSRSFAALLGLELGATLAADNVLVMTLRGPR